MSQHCTGATMTMTQRSSKRNDNGEQVSLDVVRLSRDGAGAKARAFIVFGEHARELISPESGLDLVKNICGKGGNAQRAGAVLDGVDITIVPNANPVSRERVEQGFACKRTNEDGVDLNRNWGDEHRDESAAGQGSEMDPGPRGFSEPETQMLRDLIQEDRPDLFLSVHSGAYLLGMPLGYTPDRERNARDVKNPTEQREMLQKISDRYCGGGCPYGSLAQMIGYNSKGCDIDYVSQSLGVPYAYEWEIYVDKAVKELYQEKARAMRDGGAMGDEAQTFFQGQDDNNVLQKHLERHTARRLRSSRAATRDAGGSRALMRSRLEAAERSERGAPESAEDPQGCTDQFNPQTEQETRSVIDNWTNAYLDLMEMVAAKKASPVTTSNTESSASVAKGATAFDP